MSSFLNKRSKFLVGISSFPLHPNPCKLRFSFFHLNVSIAWIIFMSLCFVIKDISHSGLPLHLASDVFALRGHKTHPPRPPLASCLLLQLSTSWAWPSLLPCLFLCPFLSPWTCQRFVQGEAADFTVAPSRSPWLALAPRVLGEAPPAPVHTHLMICELLFSVLCLAEAALGRPRARFSHSA